MELKTQSLKAIRSLPGHGGSERGVALLMVILLMVILLSATGAGLLFSSLNHKTANNLKTGGIAIQVADAGVQHALAVIPWGSEFDSLLTGSVSGFSCSGTCNGSTIKPTLTGSLPSISGYTYSVVVEDDADELLTPNLTNDSNRVVIVTSTATASDGSQRKIKAYIGRSSGSWKPPGALYFTGIANSNKFFDPSGRSFKIDGNDTAYDETTPSTPASPIPGVATNDGALTSDIINSLSTDEKNLIKGEGYSASPLTPSVQTSSDDVNINQMVTDFYNQISSSLTCPPKCENGIRTSSSTNPPTGTYSCPTTLPTPRPTPDPCIWGTAATPQITYVGEGTDHIHIAGNVTGSGVLVLEGKVHIQGDFNFHGLVIVKEPSQVSLDENDGDDDHASTLRFKMKDRAKVFGAMLVGPNGANLRFDIKNNAKIFYSSEAISMVNSLWNSVLPQPAKLLAWQEVMGASN